MAVPSTPINFNVQTANQQILVSWDLSAGADSYVIQRSQDNVTYTVLTTISGSPLATQYLDTAVVLGTQYWYKVAAVQASSTSNYTTPQLATPTPTGEMTLSQIRLASQERADRVNSNFVTMKEWNSFINRAMFELYDILVTVYEDLYVAEPAQFLCDGTKYQYPLPDGSISFINGNSTNPDDTFVARPFYKLLGVDLRLQTATNAWVTISKYNFADRNRFVFPNTASTIYGVFDMKYRLMGKYIQFIPTPSGNQYVRLWYIPRLKELLLETDTTDVGISGWIEYVICRTAKYALDKEESDTTKLDQELLFLKTRIEETAPARDAANPDTVSDSHRNYGNGFNGGWNSGIGGV